MYVLRNASLTFDAVAQSNRKPTQSNLKARAVGRTHLWFKLDDSVRQFGQRAGTPFQMSSVVELGGSTHDVDPGQPTADEVPT